MSKKFTQAFIVFFVWLLLIWLGHHYSPVLEDIKSLLIMGRDYFVDNFWWNVITGIVCFVIWLAWKK
jgi:asparagine N-glycosylation enzyme membrane subunit Stt3